MGQVHSDLSHWTWEGLAERIRHVRAAAPDGRSPTLDVLVQKVAVTDDPRAVMASSIEAGMPEALLDSPFLLVGPAPTIHDRLTRLATLGITAITVFATGDNATALAPFIPHHH